MKSEEIRKRFLSFFKERGHAIIPSASLVPENDPSVLFTTAGMQPLVPYLLGEKHPAGNMLANVQKCVRTQDIEEVGDKTHDTFFEMLGNWSLGSYFKEDAIKWSYEFLTNSDDMPEGDRGLGLDPKRLYITCFEGDEDAPKDEESAKIWQSLGIPTERIYFFGKDSNWWSPGDNGPCGPDTEMFYDLNPEGVPIKTKEDFKKADGKQRVIELWNDVFMEYEKKDGKVIGKLKQKNVDTGAGLERLAMVMQGKDNIFDTDLFKELMAIIDTLSNKKDIRAQRIIADHIRTAVFLSSDGVFPEPKDRGYILRRLIRRATYYARKIDLHDSGFHQCVNKVIKKYSGIYSDLTSQKITILSDIESEQKKFNTLLENGEDRLNMLLKNQDTISGLDVFQLVTTYGFPIEMIIEIASASNKKVDIKEFEEEMRKHQEISKAGVEKKFKGGLADTSEKTTMLHTSTHLMLAGLRKFLGKHIHQAGSNITTERTRFDFTHPEKVERGILDKVESYVNEAISKKCDVIIEQMPKNEAQKRGVEGSFWERYPDVVNVYMVKCDDGTTYSQELCGGPHVKNTGDIKGVFKIKKEEAISAGIRRIKAVLE